MGGWTNQKMTPFQVSVLVTNLWPLHRISALCCPANDTGTFLPCQVGLGYACQYRVLEGPCRKKGFLFLVQSVFSFGVGGTSPSVSSPSSPPSKFCFAARQQTSLSFSGHLLCSLQQSLSLGPGGQGPFFQIHSLLGCFVSIVEVVAYPYISYPRIVQTLLYPQQPTLYYSNPCCR